LIEPRKGLGYLFLGSINYEYLNTQIDRPDFSHLSIANDWRVLFAFPYWWAKNFCGPTVSLLALAGILFSFQKTLRRPALPFLCWLLVPIVAFTIISKRHDFYIVAAVPATIPLAALGLDRLVRGPRSFRRLTIGAALLAAFLYWYACLGLPHQFDLRADPWARRAEGYAYPYLFAPRNSTLPSEMNAMWINGFCGPQHVPLLFIDPTPDKTGIAFYLWNLNPALVMRDLTALPQEHPDDQCVIIRMNEPRTVQVPWTIEKALQEFKNSRRQTFFVLDPTTEAAADRLAAVAGEYRLAAANGSLAIYLNKGRLPLLLKH